MDAARADRGAALKRRGILAAAGAVVAGIVAKGAAQPVGALSDTNFVATGTNDNFDARGTANFGLNTFNGTFTYGVYGRGITGIYGTSTKAIGGVGIVGAVDGALGVGVQGASDSYLGVVGLTGTGIGVYGTINGLGGAGTANTAVKGEIGGGVTAANTVTVYGNNQASGTNGTGVLGVSATGIGVEGTGASYGVYGHAAGGTGVYGLSTSSYGGVFITTSTTLGQYGVLGGANGAGVAAFGGANPNAGGYAAYFTGNVRITGGKLILDSQTLQSLNAHSDGTKRVTYAVQGAEALVEDIGKGQLVGGKAEIALDPAFAGLIATDDYHVFLTEYSESRGLYVSGRSVTGFAVQERSGGTSNGSFSWRVVATPKGAGKAQRLARHELADLKVPTAADFPAVPPPPVPPTAPTPEKPHDAPAPPALPSPLPPSRAAASPAPAAPAIAPASTSAPTAAAAPAPPQPAPPPRP